MKYNYQEVISIIENTRRFGNHTGYEVSKHMLERLGNPQCGIPFVHIAGTNGKGSTTAFLCSILQQAGKKTGMFTSPHLVTFRERIRINGTYIPEEDVTRLGNLLLETKFDIPPTMFDYCLVMAVLYFKEQQCDIMVMETGIGGRYDSTNALGVPEAAVITKIGLDHTAVLGDTLELIAGEKAGIIKKGCPVVTTAQEIPVREVLLENFRTVNDLDIIPEITHTRQEREENIGTLGIGDDAAVYEVSGEDMRYVGSIPMRMQGGFQIENAATAMLAAKVLFHKWMSGDSVSREKAWMTDENILQQRQLPVYEWEKCIRDGISNTLWKGRLELINTNPFFLIDGAHNAHGVHALAGSLKELYPGEKFHFIMAVMADKDYEDMIEELLPLAVDFITVTPESNRALQSKDLAECIRRKGVKAVYAKDMEAVIRPLLPQMQEDAEMLQSTAKMKHLWNPQEVTDKHKTIAFGSLYFIGAIEAMLEENRH